VWQNLDVELQNAAIDLKNDRTLQMKFDVPITSFWISLQDEYPELSMKAVDVLLQFSTLWLCEHRFSALVNVKINKRQRLTAEALEDDVRICLSNLSPRINLLCKKHQGQIAH